MGKRNVAEKEARLIHIYIFINISEGTAFLLQGLIITYNVKQYVIPLRRKAVPSEILIKIYIDIYIRGLNLKSVKQCSIHKVERVYVNHTYIYICIPYCKISLASFVYIFTYC